VIVFDLVCHGGHVFEGWFASSDDHASQAAGGLIACPLCDDRRVIRAVTAAAVPAKANRRPDPVARLLAAQRAMEARSEWVGDDFDKQARALHANGDTRCIHGRASLAEAQALHDDGLAILPLPFAPKAVADS
jgi:hypothetical protein